MPAFPQFKPLAFEDQPAIEALTRRYPPYSDLEFASLWAWNVREEMAWSTAGDTLILRFSDYATGRPFLTFLGDGDGVAEELLDLSAREGWGSALLMVPEASLPQGRQVSTEVRIARRHDGAR